MKRLSPSFAELENFLRQFPLIAGGRARIRFPVSGNDGFPSGLPRQIGQPRHGVVVIEFQYRIHDHEKCRTGKMDLHVSDSDGVHAKRHFGPRGSGRMQFFAFTDKFGIIFQFECFAVTLFFRFMDKTPLENLNLYLILDRLFGSHNKITATGTRRDRPRMI